MKQPDTDDRTFSGKLRKLLDSRPGLDEITAARLQASRRRAVAAMQRPRRHRGWLPAGGLAAATVAALALLVWQGNGVQPVPDVAAGDWEILASGDLELLEELDFYDWLAEEDPSG